MKISLKSLVATAALALVSLPSLAQVTVPAQPAPGPIPTPGSSTAGGLLVVAWDAVRGVSISQYLGLTMDQFLPAAANAITAPLEFGTLGGWNSIFTGSNATDIKWALFAGDSTGTGTTANRRLMTTSTNDTGITGNALAVNNSITTVSDFTARLVSASCNNGLLNPCNATAVTDQQYAGRLGDRMNDIVGGGARLPFSNTSLVGDSMAFWLLTTGASPTSQSTVASYGNALGLGRWLLNATGQLTYALPAVPLPAGVWLLMSGLAGFAAVGRRKNQAAVAA